MTLPARIAKKKNRTERWVSTAHRNFVRSHECVVPNCHQRPIEVAHVRIGSDAGLGKKPSDWFTVSLCGGPDGHHAEQHRIGEASFQELHKINLHALASEFAKASPKAGDIRREQRERDVL